MHNYALIFRSQKLGHCIFEMKHFSLNKYSCIMRGMCDFQTDINDLQKLWTITGDHRWLKRRLPNERKGTLHQILSQLNAKVPAKAINPCIVKCSYRSMLLNVVGVYYYWHQGIAYWETREQASIDCGRLTLFSLDTCNNILTLSISLSTSCVEKNACAHETNNSAEGWSLTQNFGLDNNHIYELVNTHSIRVWTH